MCCPGSLNAHPLQVWSRLKKQKSNGDCQGSGPRLRKFHRRKACPWFPLLAGQWVPATCMIRRDTAREYDSQPLRFISVQMEIRKNGVYTGTKDERQNGPPEVRRPTSSGLGILVAMRRRPSISGFQSGWPAAKNRSDGLPPILDSAVSSRKYR